MTTDFSYDSANWTLPSRPTAFVSTLPNYEEALPMRVNREGVQNYMKNRGSLNIGDWATENRRTYRSASSRQTSATRDRFFEAPPPKVIGTEALRNYTRSVSSTPNLIHGNLQPPEPHHGLRVKREGLNNCRKHHHTQVKGLLEDYGKFPLPTQPAPNTLGEVATNIYYAHKEGRTGPLLNEYGRTGPSPRPMPNVKGSDAEMNLRKSYGSFQMLEHTASHRPPTLDPHVKGAEAHINFDMAQGHQVGKLVNQYGTLPRSTRVNPKVKNDGIDNFVKAQGSSMGKILSQCPPSNRYLERPRSVI